MNRSGKLWPGILGALLTLVVAGVIAAPRVATHTSVAEDIGDKCLYKEDKNAIQFKLDQIRKDTLKIRETVEALQERACKE